jgi:hypothetical protein
VKPSVKEVGEQVQVLEELVAFFPKSDVAQRVIVTEIHRFCADSKQLKWFIETYARRVSRYESLAQLRAVFCSRYRPDDGIYPTVDVPGLTSNDLEAQYLAREAEETDKKLLEWRREAQQGLLTGEVSNPIELAVEPQNDVERLLPTMAAVMAFPEPRSNGPLTLENVIDARLAYLKNPDELKKQWRKRESEELQTEVRKVFPEPTQAAG